MYKIKDDFTLQYSSQEVGKIKDNIEMSDNKSLYARIAASHAGLINRNNFMYLPDKMRASIGTFLTPFQKPILVNHDEQSDPIGRIVSAKYVDTSLTLKDSINELTDKYSLNDVDFRRFLYGEMDLMDQVEYIQDSLYDKMLDDPNFSGLGYAEIIGHIKDEDAVQKFLDQRYLTGSVAAGTNHAICSVCKTDWSASSGRCEHSPGKLYDKKKAFLIAGMFTYEHWAVVNSPADGFSQALEVSTTQVLDVKNDKNDNNYTLQNISIELLNNYSKEESMKVEDNKVSDETAEVVETETPKIEDKQEIKTEEIKDETVISETEEVIEDSIEVTEESFEDLMTRVLDETQKASKEDVLKIDDMLNEEMKEIGLTDELLQDAELSSEKRKKLPKSVFCGPDKSFPVNDCAHVTAARRLIGRYKGPGDKEKILACVNRKAKAMGCGEEMEDSVKTEETEIKDNFNHIRVLENLLGIVREQKWSMDEQKPLDEAQLGMVQELISAMAGMVTEDSLIEALLKNESLSEKLTDKQDNALLDEVVKLESRLGELRDEKSSLEEELKLTIKESEILKDSAIKSKTEARELKLDKLTLLKTLKDKKVIERDTLISLNDSALETELENLKELSLKDITTKLDDGLARNPQGTVENPLEISDVKVDNSKENEMLLTDELARIEENFMRLALKDSHKAKIYMSQEMDRLKKEGKLPK